MKLWLDDVRPAPDGYVWCKSVNEAKILILKKENSQIMYEDEAAYSLPDIQEYFRLIRLRDKCIIELIDIDHDAGDFACDGGDYIKLLDWLEETGRNYPIRIHSMNPVGVANMRAIIERNGWKEIR